jgi:hypothetical protein
MSKRKPLPLTDRSRQRIRDSLLAQGVANLKEFGFVSANNENILTDIGFKQFFIGMLTDEVNRTDNANIEAVKQELIIELQTDQ